MPPMEEFMAFLKGLFPAQNEAEKIKLRIADKNSGYRPAKSLKLVTLILIIRLPLKAWAR